MNPKFKTLNVNLPADFYDELKDYYVQYLEKRNLDYKMLSFSKFCVILLKKSLKEEKENV